MPMNIDALVNRKESDVYKLLGAVLQARYPELVSAQGTPVNISNVSEPKYGGIFKKTIELPQQLTKEPLSNDVLASALNSVLHEYKHRKDAVSGSPGKALLKSMTPQRQMELETRLTESNLPSTNMVRGAAQVDEALATKFANEMLGRMTGLSYYGSRQDATALQELTKLFPELGATK